MRIAWLILLMWDPFFPKPVAEYYGPGAGVTMKPLSSTAWLTCGWILPGIRPVAVSRSFYATGRRFIKITKAEWLLTFYELV